MILGMVLAGMGLLMQGAYADCQVDTGGECNIWGCAASRNATCQGGRCVCGDGLCADAGQCVPAAEADPTHICSNNKPCGCSVGGQRMHSPLCLNYMQCGSSFAPGICADAGVRVNFSIKLDGLETDGVHVKATNYKCCISLPKSHPETFLGAVPEHLKGLPVDQPEVHAESKDPYQMITLQGTGAGLFFSGVFVGAAFVAPWFVLAFIGMARYRRAGTSWHQQSTALLG